MHESPTGEYKFKALYTLHKGKICTSAASVQSSAVLSVYKVRGNPAGIVQLTL